MKGDLRGIDMKGKRERKQRGGGQRGRGVLALGNSRARFPMTKVNIFLFGCEKSPTHFLNK